MTEKISILLVDDHSLVRQGFRRILEDEPDLRVVGEAGDGNEAVKLARELKPTVIVMDCALPGASGLIATRKILESAPKQVILMLSMHSEETWVRQALDAGARGEAHSGGLASARRIEGSAGRHADHARQRAQPVAGPASGDARRRRPGEHGGLVPGDGGKADWD